MAIRECTCKSDYQDKRYGEKKRVMNKTKSGDYTCTVCGRSSVETKAAKGSKVAAAEADTKKK